MIPEYLKKQFITIILPSFIAASLFIAAIFYIILPAFHHSLMQNKKDMVRELTHMGWDILNVIEKQEKSGKISREQAQALAIEKISNLHYGPENKDYFWINDLQPTMIMHPYRSDLTGKNLSEIADPDGKLIFAEFVEIVTRKGSGFLNYRWQWKDDPEKVVPKLSYVTLFEPWNWVIGTGIYLEDVRVEFIKITHNLIYISAGIFGVLALFWMYSIVHGIRCAKARQKAETEVDHYRENLQSLVETRTNELASANELLRIEISDRKNTEKNLRESESRYRKLFELANDAILITQGDLCVGCNNKALEMFGCTTEQQFTAQPLSHFSPETQPDGQQSQQGFLEKTNFVLQGKPQFFEWCHARLDGTVFDADVSMNLIEVNGEKFVQIIIRDITLRKEREKELHKNQKLESLGILAGGIAHDFNNLLTVIIGNISLVKKAVGQDVQVMEKLSQSEKASIQAKELTQQLLTFSKGGAPIKKVISIEELITEATIFSLRGSNIKYEYIFEADLWPVEVDEGQLYQVIQNLVINSYQAMPGGGKLCISAENTLLEHRNSIPLNPGKYIKIAISDEGKGISQEHLQLIFDPYFTTKNQGSGLGLAVVYSVIHKHEGYITVDSKIGTGTNFQIYLPATRTLETYPYQNQKNEFHPGSGKIMVLDDEKYIRQFVSSALEVIGYTSVTVSEGLSAINLYIEAMTSETPFDAVIMDLTIPGGMGGKEVIQQLRKIDPGIKSIVASGYANDQIMANFQEYGFTGRIAKPFDIAELSMVLHEILQ